MDNNILKKIKVLSIGEVASPSFIMNKDVLLISFYNSNDFSIVEKQQYSLKTNPTIIDFSNNILSLQKDDIIKLSFFNNLKHQIKPYSNIFSIKDSQLIINFLNNNDYKNKDIYIQCEYGKSRSLSTAIALEKYFLNNTHFLEHNENIIRNKIIYECIKKYLGNNKNG